jgi:hypothetical protein
MALTLTLEAASGEAESEMKKRTNIALLAIVNVLFLVGIIYNLAQYATDNKVLDSYIDELRSQAVISDTLSAYDVTLSVRDHLLVDINYDLKTCEFFDLTTRPFWSYRVSDIIEHREGQCVESTRLMVNIFSRLGIPSRKVYLFGDKMHCVMEVHDGREWILLDTINSPAGFKEFSQAHRTAVTGYFQHLRNGVVIPNDMTKGFGYSNYGYFNWNKVFNRSPFICEVYMHGAALDRFQIILENPPLFFAVALLVVLAIIDIIGLIIVLKSR